MTQQEILEYNKRCAEFLYPNAKEEYQSGEISIEEGLYKKAMLIFEHFNLMRFHSDWTWIMEVVDAVEKLKTETSTFDFYIQPKSVLIKEERNYSFEKGDGGRASQTLKFNDSVWITGKTKKEAVVQAINQFLIWYNNEQRT